MQKLTKELHRHLFANGYRYLVIKDVQPIQGSHLYKHIFQALKEMPPVAVYPCTSIQDEMITSVLSGHANHIELYLEQNVMIIDNEKGAN